MNKMSKSEYAEYRGISRPAVSKLARNDRIILYDDGTVDVEASDLILDYFANESQGTRIPSAEPKKVKPRKRGKAKHSVVDFLEHAVEEGLDYNTGRSLLTHYTAELKKLELDEKKGESIATYIVEREAFECARRTRDAIFAIEDRIADILAAETDRAKIKDLLNKEHRIALDELASMPVITKKLEDFKNGENDGIDSYPSVDTTD